MKTLLTLLLLSLTLFSEDTLIWVDKQIEAIKPPRATVAMSELSKVADPFVFLNVKKIEAENAQKINNKKVYKKKKRYVKLTLSMIMNKKARINSKWYKLGDTLYGYKITKIDENRVTLTQKGKKRILTTYTKKKNLIIKDHK